MVKKELELKSLIQFLKKGAELLSLYMSKDLLDRDCIYNMDPNTHAKQLLEVVPYSYLRNADTFYSVINFLIFSGLNFSALATVIEKSDDPKSFVSLVKDATKNQTNEVQKLNEALGKHVKDVFSDSDEVLKSEFLDLVTIEKQEEFDFNEGSEIYAKLNHGYWEFLLNSFVEPDDRVHNLASRGFPMSHVNSGFHAALLSSIVQHKNRMSGKKNNLKFSISLTAGQELIEQSLSAPLNPGTRGALMGISGFLKSAQCSKFNCFDGSLPRNLLKERKFDAFLLRKLEEHDAVLFLVPVFLKNIEITNPTNNVYTLSLPAQVISETYQAVLPTIIGFVEHLLNKNKKLVIFNQSGAFSMLLGAHLSMIFDEQDRLSFYDLGRVLDIASPDVVKRWPSTSSIIDDKYISQVNQIIRCPNETPAGIDLIRM